MLTLPLWNDTAPRASARPRPCTAPTRTHHVQLLRPGQRAGGGARRPLPKPGREAPGRRKDTLRQPSVRGPGVWGVLGSPPPKEKTLLQTAPSLWVLEAAGFAPGPQEVAAGARLDIKTTVRATAATRLPFPSFLNGKCLHGPPVPAPPLCLGVGD